MKRKEFLKLMEEDEDWEPGEDALDDALEKVYPNIEPIRYEISASRRHEYGGDNYLDEFDIYKVNNYFHIITYGMSELDANVNAFGGITSKWGYEMTIKIKDDGNGYLWALDLLSSIARYTNEKHKIFKPGDVIALGDKSLNPVIDSKITALFVLNDTDINSINTIYGKVDFLQLYGITEDELISLQNGDIDTNTFMNLVKSDNNKFITDMERGKSYII